MTDAPIALIGHHPDTARALRELGLVALTTPAEPLADVLAAARTLRYAGMLVGPAHEGATLPLVQPDSAARRTGGVDAVALTGSAHGTHTLEDALVQLVERSGYATRGARLLVIGEGPTLQAAAAAVRLGGVSLTVAAPSRPQAEQALVHLPANMKGYALSTRDEALPTLAERADLVILASGSLPAGVLQPFHTLLDLTGTAAPHAARHGVTQLDASALPALRLSLQLEHATGQRFTTDALHAVTATLSM